MTPMIKYNICSLGLRVSDEHHCQQLDFLFLSTADMSCQHQPLTREAIFCLQMSIPVKKISGYNLSQMDNKKSNKFNKMVRASVLRAGRPLLHSNYCLKPCNALSSQQKQGRRRRRETPAVYESMKSCKINYSRARNLCIYLATSLVEKYLRPSSFKICTLSSGV